MKRIVPIFILFILLVAGGAAFWKFGMPLLNQEEEVAAEEGAEGEGDEEEAEAEEVSTANTIAMSPMVLPVIKKGKVSQHVTVVIKLLVPDLYAENKLHNRLPRLRDAFLTEMHSLMSLRFVQENDKDMTFIRKRLMLVGDRILGEGVLEDVVIDGVERRQPRTTGTG
ncbi:hypothetical protein ACTL6U_01030 [Rhodovibrionaceae bacterium A322]